MFPTIYLARQRAPPYHAFPCHPSVSSAQAPSPRIMKSGPRAAARHGPKITNQQNITTQEKGSTQGGKGSDQKVPSTQGTPITLQFDGNVNIWEFRKRMGLKLHTPLHIELRLGSHHNLLNQKEDTTHTIDHQPRRSWNELKGKPSCFDRENIYKSDGNDLLHSESPEASNSCSGARYKNAKSGLHSPSHNNRHPPSHTHPVRCWLKH